MTQLQNIVDFINNILWSNILIYVLIALGVWFTVKTKCVQLFQLKEMIRIIFSSAGRKTKGKEISPFQAFCVSTASHVGVGNIAGVALAITLGGPGAIFWMWCIAFIGCATGFVESTLAQIYKIPQKDGGFHGGPAYYIQNALKSPFIARLFAVLISITFGLIYVSVQANTIALSFENSFGVQRLTVAILLAIFTGIVICGGLSRIAKFVEYLVPAMALVYLTITLVVVIMHINLVPRMFISVFQNAFNPNAVAGGGLGAVILAGVKRGLFSNEAGEGSIPNAAASAKVPHPVKQGLVQSFGIYVDTWIVCSATAFIILLSGQYEVGSDVTGIALAQSSLAANFGHYAPAFLSLLVLLFAFSSIVGNYCYGEINIAFFNTKKKIYMNLFRAAVVGMVIFGSIAELNLVWNLADLFMGLLCLTNLYAITRLGKYAYIALDDYIKQRRNGAKYPRFNPNILPNQDGIYAWGVSKKAVD